MDALYKPAFDVLVFEVCKWLIETEGCATNTKIAMKIWDDFTPDQNSKRELENLSLRVRRLMKYYCDCGLVQKSIVFSPKKSVKYEYKKCYQPQSNSQ